MGNLYSEYKRAATTPPFDGPGKLKYGLRFGNGWDFCIECNCFRQYTVERIPKTDVKKDIPFQFFETRAVCCCCHHEMYVAEVNDFDLSEYWFAFYEAAYMQNRKGLRTMDDLEIREESVRFRDQFVEDAGGESKLSDRDMNYIHGAADFARCLYDAAQDGGDDMDKLDINDIRRELLSFLMDDMAVWDVDDDNDRARANDALYKQGAIEFAYRLQEKLDSTDTDVTES